MKRNRLLIAMLLGSVALSATSVSFSFAWYASATRLRVETIQIYSHTERNLTICNTADGEFVSKLNDDNFAEVGLFTPVTASFSKSWEGKDMPVFYDMSRPAFSFEPGETAWDYGFFRNEVYLKCDDDVYVGIDAEGTSVANDDEKNRAYAAELSEIRGDRTAEEYFERLSTIYKSSRISILVEDQYVVYDPYYEKPVIYGGVLDNDNDRYYDYVIHNAAYYEVFYGQLKDGYTRDDLVYLPPLEEDSELVGEANAFNARHHAGVYRLDLEANKDKIEVEPSLTPTTLSAQLPFPDFSFTLDAYQPKRLVVSFFLEGWDLDSVNAAMGASFLWNLSFRIIRER